MSARRAFAVLAVALACTAGATAADDPGFGNGGVVENARPLALEPSGEIVALDPNDKPLRLSAAGARLPFAFQPQGCSLVVAPRQDGTLTAACGGTVLRLTHDGHAVGNRIEIPGVTVTALAVGADGTVAAAGHTGDQSTVLLRLLRTGTLDAQFGRPLVPGDAPQNQGLAVDASGRILVANGALHRYLTSGQLDATFVPPAFPARLLGLTPDGRILACCNDGSLARLLANGAPDVSFGKAGLAAYDLAGYTASIEALAAEPDGGAVLVGTEVDVCRGCVGPPPAAYFYARRIGGNGAPGRTGESPGFFDPDHDCWDEEGTYVGVEAGGAVLVGGDACGGETLFSMRYTSALRRDYGPFLTLDLVGLNPRATVSARGVLVLAKAIVNHPADATVSVHATTGSTDAITGPPLRLLPGSRFGSTQLASTGTSIATGATTARAATLRLLLPLTAITPRRDFAVVVRARRPHLRYRASAVAIFSR